jgi:flagellar protein FlaG
MTIGEIQELRASGLTSAKEGFQGPDAEQAAKNRQIAKAVQTINEGQPFGANNELRFAIDRHTGETLIKIVDRATNEVIAQVPPESTLRLAAFLRELESARAGVPGLRIA